ncbi:pilus assembly protein PilW [Massilia forsythiae]|uniref:Pilus assembly protein PilW n=1 Tax=Massilia forsythiae TaxID=2728020 RepID=A0A7Z2VZ97_9BURK|nr:PilW family protein [Massilia forsythiae]QJE02153.1 pilus assembly protein PilW [Massilia forsythiae]
MTPVRRRASGFSLIELMISITIGMLALVFAMRMVTGAERSRNTALGGSDAMQNGMVALFTLGSDAGQAGFGLNDPLLAGCNTVFSDTSGYAMAPATRAGATIHPLAPVVIESNGAAPDRITFYGGSAMGGAPTLRLTGNYASGARIEVDRVPFGFARNHVIVVAPEQIGGDCALAQISDDPAKLPLPPAQQYLVAAQGSGYRFNSGNLGAAFTGGAARLFNLGPADGLAFHTWSVADGFLQLRSTDLAGASGAAATVADNVVSIKAQYGFDTRTGTAFQPQSGLQVNQWSSTIINADGSGVLGDAGDYQHVAAVRLAVVARSKAPESPSNGAACTATVAKPVVFAAEAPQGVTAVPVTVDVAVAGDSVDWRCYRYRVFETVVTLRNAGWRP